MVSVKLLFESALGSEGEPVVIPAKLHVPAIAKGIGVAEGVTELEVEAALFPTELVAVTVNV